MQNIFKKISHKNSAACKKEAPKIKEIIGIFVNYFYHIFFNLLILAHLQILSRAFSAKNKTGPLVKEAGLLFSLMVFLFPSG